MHSALKILLFVLLLLSSAFPIHTFAAPAPPESEFFDPFDTLASADLADPLESVNRAAFWLNDKVYSYALEPLCSLVPAAMRDRAERWLDGIGGLGAGGELNFRFVDAGSEAGRFLLHAVLRVIDHLDPVKTASLAQGEEDFDRVLQAFGFEPGVYLVLPLIGPSSVREGIGEIASCYLDPTPFLRKIRGGIGFVSDRSIVEDLQAYDAIKKSTLDPYLSIRNAYSQQLTAANKRKFVSRTLRPASKGGRTDLESATF